MLAEAWAGFERGSVEVGSDFIQSVLPKLSEQLHRKRGNPAEPMPHLAALICCSAFDIAVHDAYGKLLGRPVYSTYNAEFMNRDLSTYLDPAEGTTVSFAGKYPADFFIAAATKMPAGTLWAARRSSLSDRRRAKDGFPARD
jgi:L-alanine-DL-glutamate epimerase-like enolase superfamily enzyme